MILNWFVACFPQQLESINNNNVCSVEVIDENQSSQNINMAQES